MMKIISRIAIILAAALVVVGIAIGFSPTSFGQSMTATRGESVRQQPSGVTSGQSNSINQVGFNGQSARQDSHSVNGFGVIQVFQNFAVIGLIVLPFAIAPHFRRGRKAGLAGII